MTNENKGNFISKTMDKVEIIGNKLPSPPALFLLLTFITIIISGILSNMAVSVTYSGVENGEIVEKTVSVVNLMSPDSIRIMLPKIVSNFTTFFALGTVFTIILGVGVADGTGLMSALLRKIAISTPKKYISVVVVFLGIISNIASSTGYVVLVPLGAVLFLAFGRHPIAGLAAAFAGVSGGWSANLFIGTNDPMFAGMTTQSANMIDPNYVVQPVSNWYFMVVSTFLITFIGAWLTDKVIEPRLGVFNPANGDGSAISDENSTKITNEEKRGMKFAGISAILYLGVIALLTLPSNGILRHPETGALLTSPFMSSIIFIMMLLFLIPGIAFGIGAGVIKSEKDVVELMNKSISGLSSFMVLIFFASQFTSVFDYSNLGTIISVNGANFLSSIGFVGLPLVICFIILIGFINIFIAVDSAKWAMMSPIFVPMFMQLGLSPELTQVAYRIGDSSTNIIAPLMPFFVLTVAFFQKYDKKAGIGSVISIMLPYSIGFMIGWIILFVIWYLLGLPLGPGADLFYAI